MKFHEAMPSIVGTHLSVFTATTVRRLCQQVVFPAGTTDAVNIKIDGKMPGGEKNNLRFRAGQRGLAGPAPLLYHQALPSIITKTHNHQEMRLLGALIIMAPPSDNVEKILSAWRGRCRSFASLDLQHNDPIPTLELARVS